jgi:hypothetical protein
MDQILLESFELGSLKFRDEHLADFPEPIPMSFDDFLVYPAPCGGCLAIAKNPSRTLFPGQDPVIVDMFTAYGDKLTENGRIDPGEIVKMGWTLSELFVVVFEFVVSLGRFVLTISFHTKCSLSIFYSLELELSMFTHAFGKESKHLTLFIRFMQLKSVKIPYLFWVMILSSMNVI